MADIKRAFVTLPSGQQQVHYRRAGDGPTVVLLHPSPGSSAGLVALIEALSERGRTVFAPDTPGFGESDPLPDDHPNAADFATTIREALTALGIQQFDLYGAHTGAKIALELAIAAPDLVASLVLDGLALYTPEEARRQLSAYTVSLAPEWDGSHVVRAWAYRRDMSLFWPWYDKTPANRRALDMPSAERLHAQVVDMLRGATAYHLGYAAAFSHPTREAVTRVAVRTRIIFRETDVLGEHVARFPPLPSNVAVETLGRENELEQLVARLVSQTRAAPPGPQSPTRKSGGLTRDYLQTSHGQLHIRRGGPDTGIPLLMLHDVPGSSFSLLHLAEQLAAERPVLVPDLPGCGDSDAPEWPDPDLSLAPYADLLAEAFDGVDVYGIDTGAALALELASRHPAHVGSLVLHDLPTYDAREQADLVANATPAIEPSWDGAHLLTAWNIARNRFLFRPWYRQSVATMLRRPLDTLDVHAAFMDILRAGRAWGFAARAAYRYPSAERLAACRVPWTRIDADAEPAAVRQALNLPARAQTSA